MRMYGVSFFTGDDDFVGVFTVYPFIGDDFVCVFTVYQLVYTFMALAPGRQCSCISV